MEYASLQSAIEKAVYFYAYNVMRVRAYLCVWVFGSSHVLYVCASGPGI